MVRARRRAGSNVRQGLLQTDEANPPEGSSKANGESEVTQGQKRIHAIRGELTHAGHKLSWLADWKADDPKTAAELRCLARELSHQVSQITELALELESQ